MYCLYVHKCNILFISLCFNVLYLIVISSILMTSYMIRAGFTNVCFVISDDEGGKFIDA